MSTASLDYGSIPKNLMLLILVFIPLFNFCYMWFLGFILDKRCVLLLMAHSYLIIFFMGVSGF